MQTVWIALIGGAKASVFSTDFPSDYTADKIETNSNLSGLSDFGPLKLFLKLGSSNQTVYSF